MGRWIGDLFTGDTADQAAKPGSSPNPSAAANSGNSSGYRPIAISADGKNVLVEVTDRDKFDKAVQDYKDKHDGENPVVGEGWKDWDDFFDSGGRLYDDPNGNTASGLPPAPPYQRNGSSLGNFLASIPVLGYVLGPVGDVISGVGNLLTGRISTGLSQIGYGLGNFAYTTVEDAVSLAVGMTYGKLQAIAYNIERRSISGLALSIIIPTYGAMLGADWGYDPGRDQDNTSFMGDSKLEYGSRNHDYNSYLASRTPGQLAYRPAHSQWIHDVWLGEGAEPGLAGQAIRLIGTPAFYLFSKVDPR